MTEPSWQQRLAENVAHVRAAIAAAAARAGRDPAAVCLVAVTKYAPPEVLPRLPALGVPDLGESQVQQLVARAGQCGAARFDWPAAALAASAMPASAPPAAAFEQQVAAAQPRWHMVGHLQRNKVKLLLPHARILHSLDSQRLADAIEQHAQPASWIVDAFIEVNTAGESSKQGVPPDEVEPLAATVAAGCPHIRLRGLMALPPYDDDPEHSRPYFARLRALLERLRSTGAVGPECRQLSMGMSGDYPVAVEEGATFVRVGAALFAGLPTSDPRSV